MNYVEGIIKRTEFFTTAELADKLKMNVQVITRKVQAGEIRAYKIGKEWRIPEPAVFAWLETNANIGDHPPTTEPTPPPPGPAGRHRLTIKPPGHRQLLEYVMAQFKPEQLYSRDQVDQIVQRYHKDPPAVRRQLVAGKMLERRNGHYRRRTGYSLTD